MTDTETTPEARNLRHQFEFGENWRQFLAVVDERRIAEAVRSLREMLRMDDLAGKTFLDVGCGSGLFSLAAVRLRAARVLSFDSDRQSVACASELRRRFAQGYPLWEVEQGDVLDADYVDSLGEWEVVYAWGVLHHTGEMAAALANVSTLVGPGGSLFLSIYNDQGLRSRAWRLIKRQYNRLPRPLRVPYAVTVMLPREALAAAVWTARGRPGNYLRSWSRDYSRNRGMNRWHDLLDWVGGYPFEVARPEEIFDFFSSRGFNLTSLKTCGGGLGCNQFVFQRPV